MAWPEKLASGRYRGRYRDRQGKTLSLPHTYTQPAEAEREATLKEDAVRRRPAAKARARRMTWGEWCDEWLADHRAVEPGTQSRDATRLNRHIRPYWDDVPLRDIDREAVAGWCRVVAATPRYGKPKPGEKPVPLAPRTVLKIATVFSASMTAAVVAGKIDASPCTHLRLDQPAASDEHFLTRDEFARLSAEADELTRMIAEFGVGTGLRWGEIAGMHRDRLDTTRRRILVQEVFDKDNNEIKPYPKGRARRGVPITAELAAKLGAWMEAHPPVRCSARHRDGKACNGALLFPSKVGTALHYQNFRRRHWDPAVEKAGLGGVTPHDTRHTYASWLIQDGVTIEQLSKLLGHKAISTTQRYAHLGDSGWEQVREVLGAGPEDATGEDSLRAAIERLAAEKPGQWAAVAAGLTGTEADHAETDGAVIGEDAAPRLPHEEDQQEGGKIIRLDRWRRSAM